MFDRERLDVIGGELVRALEVLGQAVGWPEMRFGAAPIDADSIADLRAAEAAAVQNAGPVRRAEFASGRALLRSMLGADVVVPVDAERRPVLPFGVSASLAHDPDLVIAAVVYDNYVAVGIDLERAGAVEESLAPIILRPDEPNIDVTVAFCAKEAVYKAWSMAGGRFLEHHEVRLTIDGPSICAEIDGRHPDDPSISLSGGWALAGGRVLALIVAVPTERRRDYGG